MNRIQYSLVVGLLLLLREIGQMLLTSWTTTNITMPSGKESIFRTVFPTLRYGTSTTQQQQQQQEDLSWLYNNYLYEICRCIFIILPFTCIVSYIHKRYTVRYIPSFILSTKTTLYYCGLSYILFADILLNQWIRSLSCCPTTPLSSTSILSGGSYYSYFDILLVTKQYYGLNCPVPLPQPNDDDHPINRIIVSTVSKKDTIIILLLRLICIGVGVYIGSSIVFIALTGGIATGKSTVGKFLLQLNNYNTNTNNHQEKQQQQQSAAVVRIIDSDRIGHDILLPPRILDERKKQDQQQVLVSAKDSVYYKIVNVFGDPNINNQNILSDDTTTTMIDRIKLGGIVFQDPTLRRKLNSITHPKIISILIKQMFYQSLFGGGSKLVLVDIPLLYETKRMIPFFGIIIVVSCEINNARAIQYQRIQQRNPELSQQQIYDRIASQLSLAQKVASSDLVVWNTSTTTVQQLQNHIENDIYPELIARSYGFCSIHHYIAIVGIYYLIVLLLA